MKKTILTGLSFLLVCVSAQAEVIQSVSFNPARFGQYERLKISEQATLKGGLSAQSMRVNAAGTVTLTQTPSSGQGRLAYDILKLDAARGYSSWGSSFPSTPTLDFPSTCFSSLESCVNSTDTGALNVKFQEGSARFVAPSGYSSAPSSRINQITTAADILRLEAVYATIQGKLNVTGNGSYSFRNVSSPSTPLRLAGNWITLPSQGGGPTNGTLKWEERKTVRYADRGGDTVYVLALKGTANCNKTCPDKACPNGKSGKITYKLNPSTCTCEEVSNPCGYKYVLQGEVQIDYEEVVRFPSYSQRCNLADYTSFCSQNFLNPISIAQKLQEKNYRVDHQAAAGGACSTKGEIVFNPSDIFCFTPSCLQSGKRPTYDSTTRSWCITAVNNTPSASGNCNVTVLMHGRPYKCE